MLYVQNPEDGESPSSERKRRSVLTRADLIWPGGVVPYEFDTEFPVGDEVKRATEEALQHIMNRTCVQFIKRTDQIHYLNFTGQFPTSCHSYVGRNINKGQQELNLGTVCGRATEVVIHEVLHALGFLHEQSRADRENHVVIQYDNIRTDISNAREQFEVYDGSAGAASTQDIPYDLKSIMHYSRFLFSKFFTNGAIPFSERNNRDKMTIYAKEDHTIELGNTVMSEKDILRVNLHYNCPVATTTTAPTTSSTPSTTIQTTSTTTQTPTTTTQTTTPTTTQTTTPTIAQTSETSQTTPTTTSQSPTTATTSTTTTTTSLQPQTISETTTTTKASTTTPDVITTTTIEPSTTTTPEQQPSTTTTTTEPLQQTDATTTSSTATPQQPTTREVPTVRTILVGGQTVIVNRFGVPDSSSTLSFNALNVMLMSLLAMLFCYGL